MKKENIIILAVSCIGLLGLGSYFYMSDYKQKRDLNIDLYGNPKGLELIKTKYDPNEAGTTFGGKRTKYNRKSNRKNRSKKH